MSYSPPEPKSVASLTQTTRIKCPVKLNITARTRLESKPQARLCRTALTPIMVVSQAGSRFTFWVFLEALVWSCLWNKQDTRHTPLLLNIGRTLVSLYFVLLIMPSLDYYLTQERLLYGNASVNLSVQTFKPILLATLQAAPSLTDQQRAESRFTDLLSVATHFVENLCGVRRTDEEFSLVYVLRKVAEYRAFVPAQETMDTLIDLSLTRPLLPHEARRLQVYFWRIV